MRVDNDYALGLSVDYFVTDKPSAKMSATRSWRSFANYSESYGAIFCNGQFYWKTLRGFPRIICGSPAAGLSQGSAECARSIISGFRHSAAR